MTDVSEEKVTSKVNEKRVDKLVKFIKDNAKVDTEGDKISVHVDATKAPLPYGLNREEFGKALNHLSELEMAAAKYTADSQWGLRNKGKIRKVSTHVEVKDGVAISATAYEDKNGKPHMVVRRNTMGPAGSSEWMAKIVENM